MQKISTLDEIEKRIDELNALIDRIGSFIEGKTQDKSPSSSIGNIEQLKDQIAQLRRKILALEEERKNLEALSQTGSAINSTLELDTVLQMVMDTIIRLSGAERGFLMLKNAVGELDMQVARNFEQGTIDPSDAAISRTIVRRVLDDCLPVLTTNAQEDPRFTAQESIVAYNLRSIICVPLKVKDALIGVIYVDNRTRCGIFSENDLDVRRSFPECHPICIPAILPL